MRARPQNEALTPLVLSSKMFEIDRLVSYLIREIGYQGGHCISCLNHVSTPREAVLGVTTRRIRLE